MSFLFGSKKEKNSQQEWEEVNKKDIHDSLEKRIQTILTNQETIIENQRVVLGYIDTMTKKMNDLENRINKPQGAFSAYLRPSLFPFLDSDNQAKSIRQENIIKRKTNPKSP